MKNKRFKFAVAAVVASLVLLVGATLAYFTDSATGTATGTAGTVSISLDDSQLSLLSADGLDNFNPGDGRAIVAPITNEGNKSVDVRQSFQITMTPANLTEFTALPDDATAPMGWAIYALSDCTLDASGNYVVNAGATPIAAPTAVVNEDGTVTLTYVVPTDVVLNGTGANAETETSSTGTGKDGNVLDSAYVLVLMPSSDNSYQGAAVTLDILVEAKQHRNTASVEWEALQTATVTIGGADVDVVPNAGQASDGTDVK